MEKVRLGIIGIGNIGKTHIKNILDGKCPEIELAALADQDPKKLTFAKENYPDTIALFDDGEKMLDSGKIDAVLVAIPHYFHEKYVVMALEKGIHAISEKPAGVYTRQVKRMNAAAAKSNAVYALMFNQRTNCIYRKMHEIVQSGELGKMRRSNVIITDWYRNQAYYDSGEWRATWGGEGGGVLLNQCPHNLDYWQWICGMPVRVYARMGIGKYHDIEVEDEVTAYVEYENGATGTFITTTADVGGTNRFEIDFECGKLVSENGKLMMWKSEIPEPEFSKTSTVPFAEPKIVVSEVETDGKNEQHYGVLNAFAAHLLRGEPLVARGEEGLNELTLSNAMYLSAWTGRMIELPFDDEEYYQELKKRVDKSKFPFDLASLEK
ncbi:MAG: Gfo/Idh/MocA family oxidoreductase [Oscillospiraceae bacterium]|nr:Gfo/Idh/MocA family oxidoreductase [Oscillospiraceae bacterium]